MAIPILRLLLSIIQRLRKIRNAGCLHREIKFRALGFLAPITCERSPEEGDHQMHLLTFSGPKTFRAGCGINGTRSNLIISRGCSSNLACGSLVSNLGLPLIKHRNPYKLNDLTVEHQIWVDNRETKFKALGFMAPITSESGEHQRHLLTFLGPNTFRAGCDINGTQSYLIISSGCSSNLASESLISSLGLPLVQHPKPYKLNDLTGEHQTLVCNQAKLRFAVRCCEGLYEDDILFDVVPMKDDCIVLGRPWQFDMNTIYYGSLNQYVFEVNGQSLVLRSDADSDSGICEIQKNEQCGEKSSD